MVSAIHKSPNGIVVAEQKGYIEMYKIHNEINKAVFSDEESGGANQKIVSHVYLAKILRFMLLALVTC